MKREYLKEWEKQRLDSKLVEVSAKWDVDRVLPPQARAVVPHPRVETEEERRIIIQCIVTTLCSLMQRLPYCLAVIHIQSLTYVDEDSRNLIRAARRGVCAVCWAPGEHTFTTGDSSGSILAELTPDTMNAVGPFFIGRDPACVLLFSKLAASPGMFAENLIKQKDHRAALRAAARPGTVLAYPALDGDIVVFVTPDQELVRFIVDD